MATLLVSLVSMVITVLVAMGASATKTTCVQCGKTISRTKAVKAQHGARCLAMQKVFGTGANGITRLAAHKAKITLPAIPVGYISTAKLYQYIKGLHAAGKTIAKPSNMVRCFGTDKAALPPQNPIGQFYYVGRGRCISAWLATPAGLKAMALQQYANAPKAPTQAHLAQVAMGKTKPTYKVYPIPAFFR